MRFRLPARLPARCSLRHLLLLLLLLAGGLPGRAQATAPPAYNFVVAQDGSRQFGTVQAAFDAVSDFRKKVTTIFIKNGIYKEKLLAGSKNFVRLVGEGALKTILTHDDYNQKKNIFGEDKGTSGSASCYICGGDFTAENLTFQNCSGTVGQAVSMYSIFYTRALTYGIRRSVRSRANRSKNEFSVVW